MRSLLLLTVGLTLGGCFVVSWLPWHRDAAPPVAGPAAYVEGCQGCHPALVADHYGPSLHAAKGIRCGQCHSPAGHPNYTLPVSDATCGGCHQPQFQQTLASAHFGGRERRPLDGDQEARAHLRREGFIAPAAQGPPRFVGDAASGELGGRLCASCHYDEHRVGLGAARQAESCLGCHRRREDHFPIATPGLSNRCLQCHMRAGATERGQVVNTHRFPKAGGGS